MKRDRALVAFLGIFLILIVNPLAYSSPVHRVNESFMVQETPFLTAADGDESSASITSFSETLGEDVMSYPDHNTTYDLSGEMNSATWSLFNNEAGDSFSETASYVTLHAELSTSSDQDYLRTEWPNVTADHYMVTFEYKTNDSAFLTFSIFESNDRSGGNVATIAGAAADWTTKTLTSTALMTGIESFEVQASEGGALADDVAIDIRNLILHDVTYNSAFTGYAESFADVSDFTTSDTSISSDGDLATITENGAGDSGGAYYTFSTTQNFVGYYYEVRATVEAGANWKLRYYDHSASWWYDFFYASDSGTKKGIITSAGNDIDRIGIFVYGEGKWVKPDYLRIGPADEMGWQHDGSTTAGVSDDSVSDMTYEYSSDGDILNLTATNTKGSSQYSSFRLAYDTTATASDLESSYYPFFAVNLKMSISESAGTVWVVRVTYDDLKLDLTPTRDGADYETIRGNIVPGSVSYVSYLEFRCYLGSGWSVTWLMDYAKAYSIANFTVTQSGATTDDYLYTDSGVLYSSIDDGYIELNHDPALTVNTATYNIWNLTTSGTSPEFDNYVGSWAGYSSETRGSLSSGTLTDLKLKFDSIESISAIKFIEDGTAPAVVRSSSTPNDPEDDESTTLSAVITDTVEVYSVAFNAIVYPTGFSDVDYDATEQADNLWNYTFSSLDAGYYCFKIIASDGANNNPLTEYAYIELTVREAAIMVEEITLIGAGEDFSMMTFSARINRDCSFTIYEESASSAESDTHTGSVSSPSFNLAWTKLDVDDNNVNFTIKFTSGSLTYNYTSQYQVAQNTFYVSTVMQVDGLDTVTVLGRISKLGNYLLYDENNELKDSGSVTDLDFTIRFTKWSGYDEQDHDFAIKFTNGTQTCWYNSSYYAFKKPVAAGVVTTDKNALYAFQASFWTGVVVFFIGLMVAIDFYRRYLKN